MLASKTKMKNFYKLTYLKQTAAAAEMKKEQDEWK